MSLALVLTVLAYFALAALLLAWLLMPAWRDSLRRVALRGPRRASAERAPASRTVGGAPAWVLALGLVAMLALPFGALWWRSHSPITTFDHRAAAPEDLRIAALIRGEQLVPPPPVPPELFDNRELQLRRPLVQFANRKWDDLDPDFRQRLLVVFQVMKTDHSYDLVLLEGRRSPERQNQLAALGGHVTLARAYQSYHQFGLAADVAFLRDGKIVISELDPWAMQGYRLYGEAARRAGLTWGGDWKTIRDLGHVELRKPGVLQATPEREAEATPATH